MVETINDALGTDINPEYIECPFDDYVHDTMVDASKFAKATGREPQISCEEGIKRVYKAYREAGALETK